MTRWSIGILFCLCVGAQAYQAPWANERVELASRGPAKAVAEEDSARLRIDSSLVLVPVHVTTQLGVSVPDLKKKDFRVYEDNVEQEITHFGKDDAPVSIGLLFDASASMHDKLRKSSEAVAAFFKTANREDDFFLIEFNDRPRLTVPFTFDFEELYHQIARTRTMGRTSLLDAIHLALQQMKRATNARKAIVIVSDGGDNCSRYTVGQIKNALAESEVQLYAMGIFDPEDTAKKRPREEIDGPKLLSDLADLSGGRHYPIDDLNDLPMISERIGLELRNEYVIGYSPPNLERDGKYRAIQLKLAAPQGMPALRVQYRKGYFAPK
ncbi:MAG TPA: VWA domain-containing protein [Bryobacteraceae bacterium]|nr:VWA domain-containing protein [Bryobacteraceae bacterium]